MILISFFCSQSNMFFKYLFIINCALYDNIKYKLSNSSIHLHSCLSLIYFQAARPLSSKILDKLRLSQDIRTAAVCVYPNRIADVHTALSKLELTKVINIASG